MGNIIVGKIEIIHDKIYENIYVESENGDRATCCLVFQQKKLYLHFCVSQNSKKILSVKNIEIYHRAKF